MAVTGCNCRFDEKNKVVQWCQYHYDMQLANHEYSSKEEGWSDLEMRYGVLKEERDKLRQLVAFFACTIKSGEPWTEQCEAEYVKAIFKGEHEQWQ